MWVPRHTCKTLGVTQFDLTPRKRLTRSDIFNKGRWLGKHNISVSSYSILHLPVSPAHLSPLTQQEAKTKTLNNSRSGNGTRPTKKKVEVFAFSRSNGELDESCYLIIRSEMVAVAHSTWQSGQTLVSLRWFRTQMAETGSLPAKCGSE